VEGFISGSFSTLLVAFALSLPFLTVEVEVVFFAALLTLGSLVPASFSFPFALD
jgi:hypothetical protein